MTVFISFAVYLVSVACQNFSTRIVGVYLAYQNFRTRAAGIFNTYVATTLSSHLVSLG